MDPQKHCPRCKETKNLDEFSVDRSRPSGRQPVCKACNAASYVASRQAVRARQNAHRAANREAYQERDAKRYAEHRGKIVALKLTLSCVDCGWRPATEAETGGLDFDHVDPETKAMPGRGAFLYVWSWERIEQELALCDPRCKPCHAKRTTELRHNLRRVS